MLPSRNRKPARGRTNKGQVKCAPCRRPTSRTEASRSSTRQFAIRGSVGMRDCVTAASRIDVFAPHSRYPSMPQRTPSTHAHTHCALPSLEVSRSLLKCLFKQQHFTLADTLCSVSLLRAVGDSVLFVYFPNKPFLFIVLLPSPLVLPSRPVPSRLVLSSRLLSRITSRPPSRH